MNKKFILALLISGFSALHAVNYIDLPAEETNEYIQQSAGNIGFISDGEVQTFANGTKIEKGRIPYQNGWVKIEVRYNPDGTRDTSFGPNGMRAIGATAKLF